MVSWAIYRVLSKLHPFMQRTVFSWSKFVVDHDEKQPRQKQLKHRWKIAVLFRGASAKIDGENFMSIFCGSP